MKNFSYQGDINFKKQDKAKQNNEFLSLKLTDSLYKKDIGKFLEILSSHFVR